MIAIKEKNTVYFAYPIKFHNFTHQAKLDYSCEDNLSMWHLNDGDGTIVMLNAKIDRIADLLRYSNCFNCEFNVEGMHQIFSNVKQELKETNYIENGNNLGFDICIARGNKAYKITSSGAVFEIGEIECFNEREWEMLALYEHYKTIPNISDRVKTLYDEYLKTNCLQYYPIAIINTSDNSYELITE